MQGETIRDEGNLEEINSCDEANPSGPQRLEPLTPQDAALLHRRTTSRSLRRAPEANEPVLGSALN